MVACELVAPGERFAARRHPDRPYQDGPWYAVRVDSHRQRSGEGAVALRVPNALVLRRVIAEKVFGALVRDGAASFTAVTLVSNRIESELKRPRKLSDDWLMVDTGTRFPLDRDTLDPANFESRAWENTDGVFNAERRWSSLVSTLRSSPSWGEGRAPTQPLFRLLELPAELMAAEALLRKLRRALGKGVAVEEMRDARLFHVAELNAAPSFSETPARAAAAGAAFFRIASGKAGRSDRAKVLRSPLWSFALARVVEGAADDTRLAACQHPVTAAAYARDVDRQAREDTRSAACAHAGSAITYMRDVDRGPHPATSDAFRDHLQASKLEIEARKLAAQHQRPAAPTGGSSCEVAKPSRWVGLDAGSAPMVSWRDGRPGPHEAPGIHNPEVGLVVLGAKTAAAVKKKTAKWSTLSSSGWLVFRRSAVEPVLASLAAPQLRLHTVPVVDAGGETVDDDWGVLEVPCEWPLDRDASKATFHSQDNPHATALLEIDEVCCGAGRGPDAPAFRLGDMPSIVVFRPEVADALVKAVGRGLSRCESLELAPSYPRVGRTQELGSLTSVQAGAAAAAFWRLVAGERDEALRLDTCRSPHYGYWLARVVDQSPADDTRAAALLHPHYAAVYAQLVDRQGRDDTRQVAAANGLSALHYAKYVDHALRPAIAAALHSAGWEDADLDTLALPREG